MCKEKTTTQQHDFCLLVGAETSRLPEMLAERLCKNIEDVCRQWETVPKPIQTDVATRSLTDLNQLLAVQDAGGEPRRNKVVPYEFFTIYGQLADDIRFLRTLTAFNRRHILSFLALEKPVGPKHYRNKVDYNVEGSPVVSCRLTSRFHMNWAHAYRSLFPESYRALLQQQDRRDHLGFFYQTRLTFRMDGMMESPPKKVTEPQRPSQSEEG